MTSEDFEFNQRVQINWPSNPVLHGEYAIVIGYEEDDCLKLRFETYKDKFDAYEDTITGSVCVEAYFLVPA